jgi:hypothetical protein
LALWFSEYHFLRFADDKFTWLQANCDCCFVRPRRRQRCFQWNWLAAKAAASKGAKVVLASRKPLPVYMPQIETSDRNTTKLAV